MHIGAERREACGDARPSPWPAPLTTTVLPAKLIFIACAPVARHPPAAIECLRAVVRSSERSPKRSAAARGERSLRRMPGPRHGRPDTLFEWDPRPDSRDKGLIPSLRGKCIAHKREDMMSDASGR